MIFNNKDNLLKLNIKEFLTLISDLSFNKVATAKLGTFSITDKDKEHILDCIKTRSDINDVRGVKAFVEYQRKASSEVDEKGMTGERMMSKVMHAIQRNEEFDDFVLTTPPIAEMVLDKTKQDFVVESTLDWRTFDVKSQYSDAEYFNVNLKSFNRMKLQTEFFIAAIIHTTGKTFANANAISFYFVDVGQFEKNSEAIMSSRLATFTPYRRVKLSYFN